MATGTIKFYRSDKGYGFIVPNDGGRDVMFHITALDKSPNKHVITEELKPGTPVIFSLIEEDNRQAAKRVMLPRDITILKLPKVVEKYRWVARLGDTGDVEVFETEGELEKWVGWKLA